MSKQVVVKLLRYNSYFEFVHVAHAIIYCYVTLDPKTCIYTFVLTTHKFSASWSKCDYILPKNITSDVQTQLGHIFS